MVQQEREGQGGRRLPWPPLGGRQKHDDLVRDGSREAGGSDALSPGQKESEQARGARPFLPLELRFLSYWDDDRVPAGLEHLPPCTNTNLRLVGEVVSDIDGTTGGWEVDMLGMERVVVGGGSVRALARFV